MRRKTERQGTEAERQLAWSREYLRREKRRRVLRRTLLMLVLALACAVTVFALNGGIPALRVGGAPASGSSAAQSSSAPAVQAQPPSSQAQPEPAAYTVAFDSRGGSAVEALQNVTQGARIAEPSSPVREGYTFEGWYRDAARTDAWDFAADTVEQDTILYAKWEAVPAQDTTSGAALPQTGVATGALLWACVPCCCAGLTGAESQKTGQKAAANAAAFVERKTERRRKAMDAGFINLTPENLDGEHLCCIIRSKKAHPGVEAKRQWLADRLKEGHIFRKLNAKATVFIEYAPLETACPGKRKVRRVHAGRGKAKGMAFRPGLCKKIRFSDSGYCAKRL